MSVELMTGRNWVESIKETQSELWIIYDDIMNQKVLLEQEITNEMEWALEGGQFQVYIQPIYSLKENCLVALGGAGCGSIPKGNEYLQETLSHF